MDPQRQIAQMKQFILSEAREIAEEIQTKASNEAYVRRSEQSRVRKEEIDRQCQRELEKHRVAKRVEQAEKLKLQRDRVLAARTKAMDTLRKKTEEALKNLASNKSQYSTLFKSLVKQAADSVEATDGQKTTAILRVRKADESLAKEALNCNSKVTLTLDSKHLDDKAIGGCTVIANQGKIICNNTLQHRLENCMEEVVPILRNGLFNN